MKKFKFWAKLLLCTLKESLEEIEIRFRLKDYDFLETKKQFFQYLKTKSLLEADFSDFLENIL